jgi:Cu2+-exporting ATPase
VATAPTCAHCGLRAATGGATAAVGPAVDAALADPWFCCAGCRAAHAVIAGCGLGEFYRLRGATAQAGAPPAPAEAGDAREALGATVTVRGDGLAQVSWYVTGMHCAACVWLLEQLPRLDAGVRQARVAFARGRLTVVYDPLVSDPARQAALLGGLGYRVRPFRGDGAQGRDERRALLMRLAVAAASALGAMHLSLNLYAGEIARDLDARGGWSFGLLAGMLAVPGLTYGAAPFYRAAWAALRQRRLTIDVSASLVIAVGIAASLANLAHGSRELYFDAVTMFVALLLAGRVAVLAARERVAAAADGLDHLLPLTARKVAADGTTVDVPTAQLAAGELIEVERGEALPCDGVLVDAAACIDAAALSGESRPVTLVAGDALYAGTSCLSPALRLRIVAVGGATRMGRALAAIGDAAARPSRLVRLADRLQSWFIAAIAALALLTLLAGWLGTVPGGAAGGLDRAIALVLVSCPCALGLATPLVQALAVRRATARGLLIRDPGVIEALGGLARSGGPARSRGPTRSGGPAHGALRHAVIDKTGTLSEGRLRVVAWHWLEDAPMAEREWLRAAVHGAEARSQHPLALALCAELAAAPPMAPDAWREVPGQGLVCGTGRGELRIGNRRLTGVESAGLRPGGDADTVLTITLAGRPTAQVALADPLRPDASLLLARLRAAGLATHLCSGDDPRVAKAVGAELGFDPELVHGGMAPEDKAALVDGLGRQGAVLAIGDGLNDAAALARADVAIGLRGGVEAAIASCHVFVTRQDALGGLIELLDGAERAARTIRVVLLVSLLYNAAGIALAVLGVWGPYLCAVAMPASSLTAVLLAAAGGYFASGGPPRAARAEAGDGRRPALAMTAPAARRSA